MAGIVMGNDSTGVLSLLITSSAFTGFPNTAALTVNATGGLYIENTLGDITIEPLQEADGNGFNVNITSSAGFDSGVTLRNGGDIVLTAGAGVNGGAIGITRTNSDLAVDDGSKGLILKDTAGTPHY